MRFTVKSIAALKPGRARYEVWEDGRTAFGVRVSPRGVKSFVWLYRFEDRARRLTIGTYPAMGLADARVKLAEAQKQLEKGIDPGASAVEQRKAERDAETISQLVGQYLKLYARKRKRSAGEDERMLKKDVMPAWGRRKAKNITRRDVIALLDSIVERGAPIQSNRVLACIRRMFNWAVSRDILPASPCAMVRAPAKENRRDRVLSASEVAKFWHGLNEAGMSETIRLALRFQLATAQRKGEVIHAEWPEFDFNDEVWTIPPEKSKNGMAHRVPLSPLALDLLEAIKSNAGESRWLFPSPRGDKPVTGPAVDHALRNNRESIGVSDVTPHDLRRSAASHMTSMGISRLVVSKLLNHAEHGVTAVYDRHSYDQEKRHAFEAWGKQLKAIISGKSDSNVVVLQRA